MDSSPNDALPSRIAPGPRLGLALLFVVALVLRLVGIDHGLPHQTEPDGLVFATQTALIRSGAEHPEREREWGYYPQLVPRLAALVPAGEARAGATLEEQLEEASRDWLDARLVVALLSLLAVPASFALARRFLSDGWALAAAALTATSTLTLWFAQQARPHAAAAALALVAVVAALRLAERGRWIDVLWAGLAAGLAVGSLQFGVFVLPPIFVALLYAPGRGWGWRVLAALVVLAHVGLAALAFYPLLFLSGHVVYTDLFNGRGFMAAASAIAGYEPWIGLWALVGAVLLAARFSRARARPLLIVLAYAVPFLIVIGLYQRTYQRFVIPLVPYLALLAAAGAARSGLRGAFALLLVAPQLVLAVRLSTLRSRPDTIEESARWLESQPGAREQRVAFLPTHDLPLPQQPEALAQNAVILDTPARPWFRYQKALAPAQRLAPGWNLRAMPLSAPDQQRLNTDPPRYLRELEADWLLVEVYTEGRKPLVLGALHPSLAAVADRVVRFAPEEGGEDDLPLTWSDDEYPRMECWALRLFRAQRLGPAIEIWRVRP